MDNVWAVTDAWQEREGYRFIVYGFEQGQDGANFDVKILSPSGERHRATSDEIFNNLNMAISAGREYATDWIDNQGG